MVLIRQKKQEQNTQTCRVTKQVSRTSCDKDTIESGEKEEKVIYSLRVLFTVVFFSVGVESLLDCSAQAAAVSNYHHPYMRETDFSTIINMRTFYFFLRGVHIYFRPFQTSPLLRGLLIRNYANDPKTERNRVRQCGRCYTCLCAVPSSS